MLIACVIFKTPAGEPIPSYVHVMADPGLAEIPQTTDSAWFIIIVVSHWLLTTNGLAENINITISILKLAPL